MGFMKGITTGAIIGAAAGMLVAPQLDRGARKKLKRSSKYMKSMAGNMLDDMMDWMK